MTFELLPNEILIECFEYLNISEIFYSFDHLNERFNHLIRTIPLHVNFHHVQKSTFDQLCKILLSNLKMQKQVYSLHLSNQDTCGQIELFLSFFSLEQFPHLQFLTLTEVEEINVGQLVSMLPLLDQLCSFHLIAPKNRENEILSVVSKSKLRILSMPTLKSILPSIHNMSSITNLTLAGCSLEQLSCQLFKYVPMLKYLTIKYTSSYYGSKNKDGSVHHYNANHLKQLIILKFGYKFEEFEMFVKYTPNLKNLSISDNYDIDIVDADRWENLITSSLPYLDIFKFRFHCFGGITSKIMRHKLKRFQTDFWQTQHHWFTEYSLSRYLTVMYTTPYVSNAFKLGLCTDRYRDERMSTSDTFSNVTDLTVSDEVVVQENCPYYFSDVNSLTLITAPQQTHSLLEMPHIQSLKMIMKFSNLKHLALPSVGKIESSSVLLKLMEEAPQLSSIAMNARILVTFFGDQELCKCFNRMIKKLDLYKYGYPSFDTTDEIKQFGEIFANIEEIKCNINRSDDLLFLLDHLSKLSVLKAFMVSLYDHEIFYSWFKEETEELNILSRIKYIDTYETELSVWIGRNMN